MDQDSFRTKVIHATSGHETGPSEVDMAEISQRTNNQRDCAEIMGVLRLRITVREDWRHVSKALLLIEYCLINGNENVRLYWKDHIADLNRLRQSHFIDMNNRNRLYVATNVDSLSRLLTNDAALQARRAIVQAPVPEYHIRSLDEVDLEASPLQNGPDASQGGEDLAITESSDEPQAIPKALIPEDEGETDTEEAIIQSLSDPETVAFQKSLWENMTTDAVVTSPATATRTSSPLKIEAPAPANGDLDISIFVETRAITPPIEPLPSPEATIHSEQSFQLLKYERVLVAADVGLSEREYRGSLLYVNDNFVVVTLKTRAIWFNRTTRSIRQLHFLEGDPQLSASFGVASPDGNILIVKQTPGHLTKAFDMITRVCIATLPSSDQLSSRDLLLAYWTDDYTVYFPVSATGTIIRWSLHQYETEPVQYLRPMVYITNYDSLKVFVTSNEDWWVALETTDNIHGHVKSGSIEIHNVRRKESRFLKGLACCILERNGTSFLIRADCVTKEKRQYLTISIDDIKQPVSHVPIEGSAVLLEPDDTPDHIFALRPLPVVAISTARNGIYLFDVHSGTFLHSFRLNLTGRTVVKIQRQGSKGFICYDNIGNMDWATVNEENLIEWVGDRLRNMALANEIKDISSQDEDEDAIRDDMEGLIMPGSWS